jgi:hypothetical protein
MLQVPRGPLITEQPVSLTVVDGQVASFRVAATGESPLNYRWFFEDQPINGAVNPTYMIAQARSTHAGDYRAVVSNTFGAVTSAVAVLTVEAAPVQTNGCPGQVFASYGTLGNNTRNNFGGLVGLAFTVGDAPITILELGRASSPGNNQDHLLRIVDVVTKETVASVSVSMRGSKDGEFIYGRLSSSVRLEPKKSYYLVSEEFLSGDLWRDYGGNVMDTSSAARCYAAVYQGSGYGWTEVGGAGQSYVPLNFKFCPGVAPSCTISVSAQPNGAGTVTGGGSYPCGTEVTVLATAKSGFVFSHWEEAGVPRSDSPRYSVHAQNQVLVARFEPVETDDCPEKLFATYVNYSNDLRNNFGGAVGFAFTVGDNPITVLELGRGYSSGNNQDHPLSIVDAISKETVASVMVSMRANTPDGFVYGRLSSSVRLAAKKSYYLISEEYLGGDRWRDYAGNVMNTESVAQSYAALYRLGGNGWTEVGGAHRSYVPLNFKFCTSGAAATGGGNKERCVLNVTLPAPNADQAVLTLVGQPGTTYRIEVSDNLTDWRPLATLTLEASTWTFEVSGLAAKHEQFFRASGVPSE